MINKNVGTLCLVINLFQIKTRSSRKKRYKTSHIVRTNRILDKLILYYNTKKHSNLTGEH